MYPKVIKTVPVQGNPVNPDMSSGMTMTMILFGFDNKTPRYIGSSENFRSIHPLTAKRAEGQLDPSNGQITVNTGINQIRLIINALAERSGAFMSLWWYQIEGFINLGTTLDNQGKPVALIAIEINYQYLAFDNPDLLVDDQNVPGNFHHLAAFNLASQERIKQFCDPLTHEACVRLYQAYRAGIIHKPGAWGYVLSLFNRLFNL